MAEHETHVHIHFGYAPAKPAQIEEPPVPEPAKDEPDPILERLEALEAAQGALEASDRQMLKYRRELRALRKVSDDHARRLEEDAKVYADFKPAQVASAKELSETEEKDREVELMRKYSSGRTLTADEFDWMRRRGCVRY
mgnify:CR=1 FL=1